MPTTFEIAAGTKLFPFVTRSRIDTLYIRTGNNNQGIPHYQVIPAWRTIDVFVYRIDSCESKFIRKISLLYRETRRINRGRYTGGGFSRNS